MRNLTTNTTTTSTKTGNKHISESLSSILSQFLPADMEFPVQRVRRGRLAVPLDIVDKKSGFLAQILARFEIRDMKRSEKAGVMYYYGYSEDFAPVEGPDWPHYRLIHREAAGTDYFCFEAVEEAAGVFNQ